MGEKKRTTIWVDKEAIIKLQLMRISLSALCNKAICNEVYNYETLTRSELLLEVIKREREIIEARKAIAALEESIKKREKEDAAIVSEEMGSHRRERAEDDLILAEWKIIAEELTAKIASSGLKDWSKILDIIREYKENYPLHRKRLDRYHALRAWKDTQVIKVEKKDE